MKHGVMKRADRALPTAETAGIALWRRVADQLERAIGTFHHAMFHGCRHVGVIKASRGDATQVV